jgi:hypothetical protein
MWLECGISQVVVLVGGWMDAHKTSHVVKWLRARGSLGTSKGTNNKEK